MAYIKIDYSKFEKTASSIETYIKKHNSNMGKINQEMISLSSSWQGVDYTQVKKEWDEINAPESTSGKMLKALNNYAQFLRVAGKTYKDAQSRAVNRANSLPQW